MYVSWMLLVVTPYVLKNRRQSSETAPQKQTKGRSKQAVEAECCLKIILASKIGANSSHSVLTQALEFHSYLFKLPPCSSEV